MRTRILHPDDLERYARQTVLAEVGLEGQERLARGRVLLVGLGGLGSPAALYLAAAGVGTLGVVEPDRVERSNLHRQVLFAEGHTGRAKVDAAREVLRGVQPRIELEMHAVRLEAANARALVRDYDVVVDGTDNFGARYAVNDACVLEGRPNVHGAVQRFEGQITVLAHPDGPCYRCLFPEPPPAGSVPSCAEAGVLGVLPGVIGTLQAAETLKLLLGRGEPLIGRMLRYDALGAHVREIRLGRDPRCPICSSQAHIHEVEDVVGSCGDPIPDTPEERVEDAVSEFDISVEELARRRRAGEAPVVLDVRLPQELQIARLEGDVLHIPLHLLPTRLSELDPQREYAVLCHHGGRSWQAVQYLRAHGYERTRNIVGGIDRWSVLVDPVVPRY